jgi:hypothetical protein
MQKVAASIVQGLVQNFEHKLGEFLFRVGDYDTKTDVPWKPLPRQKLQMVKFAEGERFIREINYKDDTKTGFPVSETLRWDNEKQHILYERPLALSRVLFMSMRREHMIGGASCDYPDVRIVEYGWVRNRRALRCSPSDIRSSCR